MPHQLPSALEAALIRLARWLDGAGVEWVVAGSTGRALAGFRVTPRDLDVEMGSDGLAEAGRLTGFAVRHEVDPHARSYRARGALEGIEIDLVSGLTIHGPGGNLHADFPLTRRFATPVDVGGHTVWVAPVEEQIARAVVAGDEGRLDRIADERPPDLRVDGFYLSLRLAAASASR